MSTHPLSAMPSVRAGGAGADFADLSRLVRRAGLLDRRHAYYAGKIALTLLALAGGCVAFVVLGDSWWQLGTAVFFAVMSAQLAFLGQDVNLYSARLRREVEGRRPFRQRGQPRES